jgi:hypothetical protein
VKPLRLLRTPPLRPASASGTERDARPDAASRDAAGTARPLLGSTGRTLALLFPQAAPAQRSRAAAIRAGAADLAAIALGGWVMLARQTGVPARDTLIAEDRSIFLPQALLHPLGSLTQPYAGYLQLLPRLIAEVAARLPLRDAAAGFAVAGALTASCTAVFVFHASSGHIRRPELRLMLAASVLLLPTALLSIANSGVDAPWYLLFATFWALLWRPRSRAGMAAAALFCFAAASSNALAALYLPLAAARVIALPRAREHAATLGWLAGGLVQLPAVLTISRHTQATTIGRALAFYGREVILAAVAGYHGALLLRAGFGLAGATAIAACVAAALAAWALVRGEPRVRVLVVTGLALGLILTLVPVLATGWVASIPLPPGAIYANGTRYAQAPILIIDSLAIVAVDALLRRGARSAERGAQTIAAVLLAAVLLTMWAGDFRYADGRSTARPWPLTRNQGRAGLPPKPSRKRQDTQYASSLHKNKGVNGHRSELARSRAAHMSASAAGRECRPDLTQPSGCHSFMTTRWLP